MRRTAFAAATLLVATLLQPAASFGIFSPRNLLANETTLSEEALRYTYRWRNRRPFIRYAIAPDFCESIQPLLHAERSSWTSWLPINNNFTSCERIHDLVHAAFQTWQAASPTLSFVDVSGRCLAERLWSPINEQECVISPWCVLMENATKGPDYARNPDYVLWTDEQTPLEASNPPAERCSHRTCWDCARADVVIGAFSQKNRRLVISMRDPVSCVQISKKCAPLAPTDCPNREGSSSAPCSRSTPMMLTWTTEPRSVRAGSWTAMCAIGSHLCMAIQPKAAMILRTT